MVSCDFDGYTACGSVQLRPLYSRVAPYHELVQHRLSERVRVAIQDGVDVDALDEERQKQYGSRRVRNTH